MKAEVIIGPIHTASFVNGYNCTSIFISTTLLQTTKQNFAFIPCVLL